MPAFAIPAGAAAAKLGTAMIGAGVSAGTTIYQNIANRRAQERAFQQNKQWWHERFDKEARYNHPVQQMARLKEAGLNPALMYKSGAGGAGSVSGPQSQGKIAEKYDMANLALMSAQTAKMVNDAKKSEAEAHLIKQNTELSKASTELTGLKGKGQETTNQRLLVDLAIANVDLEYKSKEKEQQYQKILQEAIKAKAEAAKAGSEADIAEVEKFIIENVHKKAAELGIDTRTGIQGMIVQSIIKGGRIMQMMLETLDQLPTGGWPTPAGPILDMIEM